MDKRNKDFQVNTDDPEQQDWWRTNTWPEWLDYRLKAVTTVAMCTRWDKPKEGN